MTPPTDAFGSPLKEPLQSPLITAPKNPREWIIKRTNKYRREDKLVGGDVGASVLAIVDYLEETFD